MAKHRRGACPILPDIIIPFPAIRSAVAARVRAYPVRDLLLLEAAYRAAAEGVNGILNQPRARLDRPAVRLIDAELRRVDCIADAVAIALRKRPIPDDIDEAEAWVAAVAARCALDHDFAGALRAIGRLMEASS